MAERRGSRKKPPNRLPQLIKTWHDVIDELGVDSLVIGGKSMGGRVASLVADKVGVKRFGLPRLSVSRARQGTGAKPA